MTVLYFNLSGGDAAMSIIYWRRMNATKSKCVIGGIKSKYHPPERPPKLTKFGTQCNGGEMFDKMEKIHKSALSTPTPKTLKMLLWPLRRS